MLLQKSDLNIKQYTVLVVLSLVLAIGVRSVVAEIVIVDGESMEPTFQSGDRVFVSKLGEIENEDIVVIHYNEKKLIKRLIGMKGDTIEFREGEVYVNGELIVEKYLDETNTLSNIESFELKEDEIFVLGDNRGNSLDSRIFGPINVSAIEGKVLFEMPWFKIE